MSADESFLARWARRKRGAAAKAHDQPMPKHTGEDAASEEAAAPLPPEEAQSHFDPASLPPIETIGTGSDIRPFLAAGVPADLTRAALRRAWSADTAIRDFIGLSENSWDFNAPGGVPGFGSLTAEDARRLLARVMEEPEASDPARPAASSLSDNQAPVPAAEPSQPAPGFVADQMKLVRDTDADHGKSIPRAQKSSIAVQHEKGELEAHSPLPRRRHGGALPD
jgi:hypothetical protein